MRIALFAAILLIVVSVPAAYAATLQLVTENGNVFSIDFDEILSIWEGYNPSNQTLAIKALELRIDQLVNSTVTNSTSQQDVIDLQNQVTALIAQLNATRTNSTATDASVAIIQGQINALVGQLNTVLTNSTATEAEIDALQDTINSLTEDLENLEQDGIGAGALGTSGRMVSAALDGYVIYGEHGKLGTITEATTYNRYTGPVDYIGIIPDKDSFTKYSLGLPNGLYNVHDSDLVPVQGSSKLVRTDGYKVFEGSAPVIDNQGRDVEIGVNGKVLVQLDKSSFGNGVTVGVDTEGVTAQVVTSQNDLINTEYRDFNGTGKFVLFEGEAQSEPLELVSFGLNGPTGTPTLWSCVDDGADRCIIASSGEGYIELWSSYFSYYHLYAQHSPPIPHVLDVYVSDVEESVVHSDTTVSVKHGDKVSRRALVESTRHGDGAYLINSTFVDGLWHMTSLAEQWIYQITESYSPGNYETGWTEGIVGANGTHVVADATPYVVRGSVDPFSSEKIPTVADSNVYVLLEGIGNDQTYTVSGIVDDTTPPTVQSIERHNPSGLATSSDTLAYKVVFSEDVVNVVTSNFLLSPDSTGGVVTGSDQFVGTSSQSRAIPNMGTLLDPITVSDSGAASTVSVSVNITHRQPQTITIGLIAPDGSERTLRSPTHKIADDIVETFTAVFADTQIAGDWNLRVHDYYYHPSFPGTLNSWALTIDHGPYAEPVTSIAGSGDTYYATVVPMRDGSYNLDLSANSTITDLASNLLTEKIPTTGTDDTYVVTGIINTMPPTVSSIERHNPTAQNTNSQTLTYKVTFSEDVTGVDAFDFVFSPDSTDGGSSGSYPVTSISGSGDTYHVTVPADTDGTYNLDLVPLGHGIADTASTPLTDTVPATGIDQTYVSTSGIDNTRPTVLSIDRHDPQNQYTDSKTLTYKVTFSEDVTGVDASDFIFSPDSTGEAITFPTDQFAQTNSPRMFVSAGSTRSDSMTVTDSGNITSLSVAMNVTLDRPTASLWTHLVAPDGTEQQLSRDRVTNDVFRTYAPDFKGMEVAGDWSLKVRSTFRHANEHVRLQDWTLVINYAGPNESGRVASISGFGDTYYATVFATQNGTYNLDLVSSGHGIEDTAGNAMTDTSVAVGTARISASGIVGAGDVRINGLPGGAPWVFETVGGSKLYSGLTSSSGSITMPIPDRSMDGVPGEFSLLVYEDGFGEDVQPGDMVADLLNKEFFPHDIENTPQNVVYIPERYMLYPITVPVTIEDVRLGKLTTDCNVTDQVRLRYLDGSYDVGSSMYVPFIPGMSALKMSIEGASVCVKFADVLPSVQIVTFSGEEAAGKNAPVIDLTVDATASAVLATNEPTSLVVSFGASGFSEHDRYLEITGVILTGDGGATITCPSAAPCPSEAVTMMEAGRYIGREAETALQHSYTKYEVRIDVFKNGQFYDTATVPIGSLSTVIPSDLATKHDLTSHCWGDGPTVMVPVVNQTTVAGGHHFYDYFCHYQRDYPIYQATTGTSWSEVMSHTFDITGGDVGDHIEVQISNRVIFNFPYPYGNYHPYNTEAVHYDWPSSFETEIIAGDDFLGPHYAILEYVVQADYGPDNRGVFVKINDGSLTLVSTK